MTRKAGNGTILCRPITVQIMLLVVGNIACLDDFLTHIMPGGCIIHHSGSSSRNIRNISNISTINKSEIHGSSLRHLPLPPHSVPRR
mmetsp:Transcript_3457/g.4280  ORF Transcript_3457/g.4280 Transcript_3457/m.4280 type:complete len:87 (-) Transcript_3457:247-507(-)